MSIPTAENRIDFIVDTGFSTGSLKIAALVQSTAGLSYVRPYDLSAQTASNSHLKIVAKGTLNGYFHMSDNTFRQITVEAFVAPGTPKNLLNPDCLKADFKLKSVEPDDWFKWCTKEGVMIRSIDSGVDFCEKMLPVYYFEGDVPGNDPNFTTYMYDPLPLWNEDAAPKQLSRAFMVNALYFDGVSAEVGGVPDSRPVAALHSEEENVSTCDSIEFLDEAGVPVALDGPDIVEELGEDVMSRIVQQIDDPPKCSDCVRATQTRLPVHSDSVSLQMKHEMKHWVGADIKVMKVRATGEDSKYVVGFYHYYTKHVKCYFIPSKAYFPAALEKYLQWYQTFRNHRLQFLTLDQAGENISREVQDVLDTWGIDLRKSTANNPYQNGAIERVWRTIGNIMRLSSVRPKVPDVFWEYLMRHALLLHSLRPVRDGKTAYELWYGVPYDTRNLHPFGCAAYAHLNTNDMQLLQMRSEQGVYLGTAPDFIRGFYIYSFSTGKVYVRTHVVFDHGDYPQLPGHFRDTQHMSHAEATALNSSEFSNRFEALGTAQLSGVSLPPDVVQVRDLSRTGRPKSTQPRRPRKKSTTDPAPEPPAPEAAPPAQMSQEPMPSIAEEPMDSAPAPEPAHVEVPLEAIQAPPSEEPPVVPVTVSTRAGRVVKKPHRFTEAAALSVGVEVLSVALPSYAKRGEVTPRSVRQALESPNASKWWDAITKEMSSFEKLKVGDFVRRPGPGTQVLPVQVLFKVKEDGTYKVRIVGNAAGRQYYQGDTYAPVGNLKSLRVILALATALDWQVIHIDVKTAFLHAPIDTDVYCEVPDGYVDFLLKIDVINAETATKYKSKDYCWKLSKALYGTLQAPKLWNKTIHEALIKLEFQQTRSDPCVYIRKHEGKVSQVIFLFVDDLILAGVDNGDTADIRAKINKQQFETDDRGEIASTLGLQLTRVRSKGVLTLSQ